MAGKAYAGNADEATEMTSAAEAFANQLIALESEIEELKGMHLQSTAAADQAKTAVAQNNARNCRRSWPRSVSAQPARPVEDARTHEQRDDQPLGDGRRRCAHARPGAGEDRGTLRQGPGHVGAAGPVGRVQDAQVEQATRNVEAPGQLSQIRNQLGLDAGTALTLPQPPRATPPAGRCRLPPLLPCPARDPGTAQPSDG